MKKYFKQQQLTLDKIEKRDWQLWLITAVVIIFLTLSALLTNYFNWYTNIKEAPRPISISNLKEALKNALSGNSHQQVVIKTDARGFPEKLDRVVKELQDSEIQIGFISVEYDDLVPVENLERLEELAEQAGTAILINKSGQKETVPDRTPSDPGLKDTSSLIVQLDKDGDIYFPDPEEIKEQFKSQNRIRLFINFLFLLILFLCAYLIQKWLEFKNLRTRLNNEKLVALDNRYADLENLFEISSTINSMEEVSVVFEDIVQKINWAMESDRTSLMIYDEEQQKLKTTAACGTGVDKVRSAELKLGESLAGSVAKNLKALKIGPETDFGQFENFVPKDSEIFSAISAPMLIQEKLIGVLNVSLISKDHEFSDSDLRKIQIFANSMAAAINNLKLIDELKLNIEYLGKAQNQLVQSEKLASLGELTAGICHEINNPMTIMTGYCELAVMHSEDKIVRDNIEIVLNQLGRCNRILGNLKAFSRKGEMERHESDLNGLVEEMLNIMELQLRKEDIALEKHLDKNVPPVLADGGQIQQVIMNILNNARHALFNRKSDKRIVVESYRTGENGLALSITNNGGAIPQEIIGKIFDPFFTTKERGVGTGLGLSICYGIISKHEGELTARNKSEDIAEFIIELPSVQGVSD